MAEEEKSEELHIEPETTDTDPDNTVPKCMIIGLAVGTVFGAVIEMLPVGIGAGLAVGVITGISINAKKQKRDG